MTRKLSIGLQWQGNIDRESAFRRVKVADDAGVDSVFVAEAWGQDAFSMLTQLADRTTRIKLGTGIINYYSRTPAALAQHFGTLDEISQGRAIIGIGASSANVIEHFHGIPFNPTLARMKETVEIINLLMAGQPLNYEGKWFKLERGFTLRFETFREHIPIYVASFRPRAVKVVAEVADGWMPGWIPMNRVKAEIDKFRAHAAAAGRDASALDVRAPGRVVVALTPEAKEKARLDAKGTLAFYVARMGDYYYEQLCDMGFAEECNTIRVAWRDHGSSAAYAAVADEFIDALGVYGSVEECRDRLVEQEEAGVTVHGVSVLGAETDAETGRAYEGLLK
jgi:alkanesulfonate monooxygenase SsuD/methylene tetrahydromethanopterin reductase-like flavin-dependent oxidoreductase (luciferase family)